MRRLTRSFHQHVEQRWFAWLCCAGFFMLTLWLLAPALRLAAVALPVPARAVSIPVNTVPLLNCWTMWWNADRLSHGMVGYWNAPIFHPEPGTFAFSEPQPATLLLAPLVWWSETPYAAYHCYLLIHLFLNGVFATCFLRWLRVQRVASVAGGVAILLLPVVWEQLDAIQLVPLWPVLWIWLGLLKLSEVRGGLAPCEERRGAFKIMHTAVRRPGIIVGVAVGAVVLASTCIHHLLMLVWVAAPASMGLILGRQFLAVSIRLLIASLIAAGLLLPLLLPMRAIHATRKFERSEQTQQALSATADQWLSVPQRAWWNSNRNVGPVAENSLNPGCLRVLLALSALPMLRWMPRRRQRAVVFLIVVLFAAVCLSLGTNLRLGSLDLWSVLVDRVPFLQSIRSIYRFAYFAQLATILLSAIAVDQLWRGYRIWSQAQRLARPRFASFVLTVWLALVVGLAVEVPLPRLSMLGGPVSAPHRPWLDYLAQQPDDGGAVLCLPMSAGYTEGALASEARWMLFATWHGRPLVNGYSGFFPASWFEHTVRFSRPELTEDDIRYLVQLGVRHVVLDRSRANCPSIPLQLLSTGDDQPRCQQVVETSAGIEVYSIR